LGGFLFDPSADRRRRPAPAMLARPSLMEAPRSDMRIEEMSQLMLRSTPGRRPARGHVGRRAAQVASALMFMQVRFSGFRALCRRSGAIAEEGEESTGPAPDEPRGSRLDQ